MNINRSEHMLKKLRRNDNAINVLCVFLEINPQNFIFSVLKSSRKYKNIILKYVY